MVPFQFLESSPAMEKDSGESMTSDVDSYSDQGESLLGKRYSYTPIWLNRLRQKPSPTVWQLLPLYILNTVILLIIVTLYARGTSQNNDPLLDLYCKSSQSQSSYSLAKRLLKFAAPANEAVRYRDVTFSAAFGTDISPYQGWPDDHKDEIWEDLYKCKPLKAVHFIIVVAAACFQPSESESELTATSWHVDSCPCRTGIQTGAGNRELCRSIGIRR